MVHECLQTDVVGEDGLCGLRDTTVGSSSVCCRRVELAEQETGLRATSIAHNETGKWETILDELLGVLLGRFQERSEVLVALLLVVTSLSPFRHSLAVENENVEEGIEQQNSLILNRAGVEEYRLTAFMVKAVAVQSWLNHDE